MTSTALQMTAEPDSVGEFFRRQGDFLTVAPDEVEDEPDAAPLSDAVLGNLFGRLERAAAEEADVLTSDAELLEQRSDIVRAEAQRVEEMLSYLGVAGPYRTRVANEEDTKVVAALVYAQDKLVARLVDEDDRALKVDFFGPEQELLERGWAIQGQGLRR